MTEYVTEWADSTSIIALCKREKVVRCRHCVNYEPDLYEHFDCELFHHSAKPDDFCAWGEINYEN